MEKSLFQKPNPEDRPPTPYELIEPEIVHLKKGYSIRHGEKKDRKTPPWILVIGFLWLAWLYVMDPVYHAWYKGEAGNAYLYLHNYGSGPLETKLLATGILDRDDLDTLSKRPGPFQDYYPTPDVARQKAQVIIDYMQSVQDLHAGAYTKLSPTGRMRYLIYIKPGLLVPTQWGFLDPSF